MYRILIIHDDTDILKRLKRYFELKKYSVITTENSSEGLKMTEKEPDIILLDVNMLCRIMESC